MSDTYHDSVAQLGERHLDRVEVAGSRPVGIIRFNVCPLRIRRFLFSTVKGGVDFRFSGNDFRKACFEPAGVVPLQLQSPAVLKQPWPVTQTYKKAFHFRMGHPKNGMLFTKPVQFLIDFYLFASRQTAK